MLNSLQILVIVETRQIFFSHFNKIRGVLDILLYRVYHLTKVVIILYLEKTGYDNSVSVFVELIKAQN